MGGKSCLSRNSALKKGGKSCLYKFLIKYSPLLKISPMVLFPLSHIIVVVGAKKASLSKIFGGRATRKVDTILEITMGAFWPTFHSIMKNATTNAMVYFLGK